MPYLIHYYNGSPIQHFVVKDGLTIGRKGSNDIQIDDATLSGEHALIELCDDGSYQINDLNSTNGILYKGKKIETRTLADGDIVVMGTHDLEYVNTINEALTRTIKIKKSWIPGVYYTQA
jgi:pSer/pThr/pTyr-binding forkhead associated (FHA) protein